MAHGSLGTQKKRSSGWACFILSQPCGRVSHRRFGRSSLHASSAASVWAFHRGSAALHHRNFAAGSSGRLAGMFQFNIVFGILVPFSRTTLLGGIGEHAWRWMLGVEAVPAAMLYTLMCFTLPRVRVVCSRDKATAKPDWLFCVKSTLKPYRRSSRLMPQRSLRRAT